MSEGFSRREFLGSLGLLCASNFLPGCHSYKFASLPERRSGFDNTERPVSDEAVSKMCQGTLRISLGCHPDKPESYAVGAGFYYSDNVIVTAGHGLDYGYECIGNVRDFAGSHYSFGSDRYVIVRDPKEDLAIIYSYDPFPGAASMVLPVSERVPFKDEEVATCGHPMKGNWVVSKGRVKSYVSDIPVVKDVSYRGCVVYRGKQIIDETYYMVSDMGVGVGNSGGPVVNSDCEVIGLVGNSFEMQPDDFFVGVIPLNIVKIERLIERAKVIKKMQMKGD